MSIGLAYSSGGQTYNVVFREFTGAGIPRQYESVAAFSRTAAGTTSFSGSSARQKYIWAISSFVTPAKAQELDSMFRKWDEDRAAGFSSGCGLTDETFGSPLTTTVVFTTPPSYIYLSPSLIQVDFGVTEV